MDSFNFTIKKLIQCTLAEIRIIGGHSKNRQSCQSSGTIKSVEDRFRNRVSSTVESLGGPKPIAQQIQTDDNDLKVDKDLTFLQDMIEQILSRCTSGEKYESINHTLDAILKSFEDEHSIVERHERNRKYLRYLDSKWKRDKEEFKDKLLKCDERIFDLENELKEAEVETSIKSRLVEKWEQARLQQTEELFREDNSAQIGKINAALANYEKELRIYSEVENYTKNEIERLYRLSEEWEDRYTKECLYLDEEIKQAKLNIEKKQDKIQELREIYTKRNIEIQAYLLYKQQVEESRRLEKLKWDSAVKIQAWWRGTMFRNGLGPYRRKKKPKKGKSGKNK